MLYHESLWNGFRRLDFTFLGRDALVILPDEKTRNGRFAMKTEYFGAFPETEIALIREGFALAYIKNRTRWGTDDDCRVRYAFSAFVATEFDCDPRFIAVGMSCGGFHAVNYASRYPDTVAFLYLDAPLLSMESYIHSWETGAQDGEFPASVFAEYTAAYGFTDRSEVAVYNDEPINRLPVLAAHKIPIGLVYGGSDHEVLPHENCEMLIRYYRHAGAPLKVWVKPDCDHHPHGLPDPSPLIAYIKEIVLSDKK